MACSSVEYSSMVESEWKLSRLAEYKAFSFCPALVILLPLFESSTVLHCALADMHIFGDQISRSQLDHRKHY